MTQQDETINGGSGSFLGSAVRNGWLLGLGIVSVADEKIRGMLSRLVDRGEQFESSERNVVGRTLGGIRNRSRRIGRRVEYGVQQAVGGTLTRAGVAGRDEIHELIDRVDGLNRKVEELGRKRAARDTEPLAES